MASQIPSYSFFGGIYQGVTGSGRQHYRPPFCISTLSASSVDAHAYMEWCTMADWSSAHAQESLPRKILSPTSLNPKTPKQETASLVFCACIDLLASRSHGRRDPLAAAPA